MTTEKRAIKSEYLIDVYGVGFAAFQVVAVLPEDLVARCASRRANDLLSVRDILMADDRNKQLFARIPPGETAYYVFTRRAREI